jgi:hypothetical protein
MKIQIIVDNKKFDISNVSVTDFGLKTRNIKEILSETELDFSSINMLKGNKILLEKSFQQQKQETLNY